MELLLSNKDARSALGGIGNTSFLALINQGKLKRVKIGRRPLSRSTEGSGRWHGYVRRPEVLGGVSRSGFHAWLTRAPSQRLRDNEEIGARIRVSHIGSYRTYGARRVWHDLLAEGYQCGLHKIERLMRDQGLRARPRRRGLPKDQGERSVMAGNVLDRQFTADKPNQKWVADFTYIWTAEGWLYVAAVIDLFSRRVVGWSMSATMTAQLVTVALIMAIWRGKPDALLHHSDQGSQICE
jgi:putative transposase